MICVFIANFIHSENLSLVGNETNDLYRWLLEEKVDVKRYNTAVEAVEAARKNEGVIITATNYPFSPVEVDE